MDLGIRKKQVEALQVSINDVIAFTKLSLTSWALFRQNVIFHSVGSFDFPTLEHLEPLGGPTMSLHLRHDVPFYCYLLSKERVCQA